MKRGHQLPLGGEWNLADAGQPLVERVGTEAALARRHEERAFGGIPLHGPSSVAVMHCGVVRSIGDSESPVKFGAERAVDISAIVSLDLSLWRIPRAFEDGASAGRHDDAHRHLVSGKGACFIGSDDARGS